MFFDSFLIMLVHLVTLLLFYWYIFHIQTKQWQQVNFVENHEALCIGKITMVTVLVLRSLSKWNTYSNSSELVAEDKKSSIS